MNNLNRSIINIIIIIKKKQKKSYLNIFFIYICWLFPLFPHIYLFELGLVDIHLTLAAANNRQGKFKSIESQDPSLCLPKELWEYGEKLKINVFYI